MVAMIKVGIIWKCIALQWAAPVVLGEHDFTPFLFLKLIQKADLETNKNRMFSC